MTPKYKFQKLACKLFMVLKTIFPFYFFNQAWKD